MSPTAQIRLFVTLAVAEALSWAGLLTGMYLKYVTDAGDLGVRIFGPVHGGLFLAYLAATLWVSRTFRWSGSTTLAGLAAAVPPFTTVVFEVWAMRSGRLSTAVAAPARTGGRL